MNERTVIHGTFVVERIYDASPTRVFAAWANPAAKAQWFGGSADYELDFRVGGREVNRGGPPGGPVYTYDARYQDIVPGRRIVYTFDMHMGTTRISVSLATVEFESIGSGTKLIFTEHGAYLDGLDTPAQHEHGTGELLDALGAQLLRESAPI
jgi:uncharacterized protein YndB with AHSA1/START domain